MLLRLEPRVCGNQVWSNIGKAMGEAEQKQGVEKVMTFGMSRTMEMLTSYIV